MDVPGETFEAALDDYKKTAGVVGDSDLGAEDWQRVAGRFQEIQPPKTHRYGCLTHPGNG